LMNINPTRENAGGVFLCHDSKRRSSTKLKCSLIAPSEYR